MTSKRVQAATADHPFGPARRQPSLHPSAYEVRKPRGISSETGDNRRERLVVMDYPVALVDDSPSFRTVRLAVILRDHKQCRCCNQPGNKIIGYRYGVDLHEDNFFMVCNDCHRIGLKVKATSIESKIDAIRAAGQWDSS